MTTIEGNKLIAEFMDKEYYLLRTALHPEQYPYSDKDGGYEPLQYHTSWDWLMPVVERIAMIYNLADKDMANELLEKDFMIWNYKIAGPGITAIWEAATEFIKWYNSTKQKR